MKQFVSDVLNTSGVRDVLRQKVPQIDRLESLDSLRDLRLTRMEVGEENLLFMACYEGTATVDLYPNVSDNLVEQGVINKENVLDYFRVNMGESDEHETVRFGVSNNSIQVFLKVYNSGYQREKYYNPL